MQPRRFTETNLFLGGFRRSREKHSVRDLGDGSLVRSIRPEAFVIQGECDQRHERRMHNPNGGSKIPRSMCVLSYFDSALRSCCRAIIWITKEKKEVRIARQAYKRNTKIEETTS